MPRQLASIDVGLLRQGWPTPHTVTISTLPRHAALQRRRDAFVVEQQAQVGTPLHQLARHIALGAAGQLHFQQGEGLGQCVESESTG
jgi:hypothetical protein